MSERAGHVELVTSSPTSGCMTTYPASASSAATVFHTTNSPSYLASAEPIQVTATGSRRHICAFSARYTGDSGLPVSAAVGIEWLAHTGPAVDAKTEILWFRGSTVSSGRSVPGMVHPSMPRRGSWWRRWPCVVRRAVEDMDRSAASDLEDRIEADLRFHRTMCQLTGNETLLHQWTSLEGSIRMSIMFAGVDRAIKNMDAKRHLEIVDAIESGDTDAAAASVMGHMAGAAETLVTGAA